MLHREKLYALLLSAVIGYAADDVASPVIRARHSLSMLWVTYPTGLARSTPPIRMAASWNSPLRFLATQTHILRCLCLSILSVMCPTDFISRGCAFSQDGGWLNPPLRFDDEPCRHKLLDLIGDLALCNVDGDGGLPCAHIVAYKVREWKPCGLLNAFLFSYKMSLPYFVPILPSNSL